MIQVTPQTRIFLYSGCVDFRKGIDGLAGICRNYLEKDPFSGSMFVFRNKRRTTLKILMYDGQGFWLFIKRLSRGRFRWWPERQLNDEPDAHCPQTISLRSAELQLLLWNGDVDSAAIGPDWKKVVV
jgi:transposase